MSVETREPPTGAAADSPAETSPAPARSWDSTRITIVAAVGLMVLSLLVMTGLFMRSSKGLRSDNPSGDPAPLFALPLVGGGSDSLQAHLGHPILLNFWASWCNACIDEAPVLSAGDERWGKEGVHFLGVDIRDGQTWAKQFQAKYGHKYPSFFDETGKVERQYGTTGQPETFFIGRDGRIKAKYVGPVDPATLERLISTIAVS